MRSYVLKRLTKCVIPAAGRGLRLRPLTDEMPKEMIRVGGKPLIEWTVREALACGLTEICLISRSAKRKMESHVIKIINEDCRAGITFCCLEQKKALGLGRALSLAKDFTGADPFALMLPDNLVVAGRPVILQMMEAFREYGLSVNALMKLPSSGRARHLSDSGRAEIELLAGPVYKVKKMFPKGKDVFPWRPKKVNYRLFPRQILLPEFFSYLEELSPPLPAEFDDVPVFQKIAEEGRLLGYYCRAEVFDAGNPEGLRNARLHFSGSEFLKKPQRTQRKR